MRGADLIFRQAPEVKRGNKPYMRKIIRRLVVQHRQKGPIRARRECALLDIYAESSQLLDAATRGEAALDLDAQHRRRAS